MCDFPAVEANMREALGCFAHATPGSEVRQLQGVQAVNAAVASPVFNAAFLIEPYPKNEDDLVRRIATAATYYGARGCHWSFWLLEQSLDGALRRRSQAVFREQGLAHSTDCPCMIAHTLLPPRRPLPEVVYKQVNDPATRLDFCRITSICFRLPIELTKSIYDCEETWKTNFRGYVGYVGGKPSATAATVASDGMIGFYSLATLPEFRRRGVAERLTRQVIEEARINTAGHPVALQSTRGAYWLYRGMGFREIGNVAVYVMQ